MLAQSFNATAAQLEALVGSQRGFIADASHQLRTPSAALRLRLENLEAEVSGPTAEDLEGALEEVNRLSKLVDGLLVMARTEQATSTPVAVDVESVIEGRREAWEAFAAERYVYVRPAVGGHPVAWVTPGRLEQVIDNLLNNALEVARRTARSGWSRPSAATGSSCVCATRARAYHRRSVPGRSTGSGSPGRRAVTAGPTATSGSASRSSGSSW